MIKKITCNYIQYHKERDCGFGIALGDYLNEDTWISCFETWAIIGYDDEDNPIFGEGFEEYRNNLKYYDKETGLYYYNHFPTDYTYDEIKIYVNEEGIVQKITLEYDEEIEKERLESKGYSKYDANDWNIRYVHELDWGEI